MRTWHILTGEFPPQRGGVSDYSLELAKALSAFGQVTVWCPGSEDRAKWTVPPAISLRELPGGFDLAGLKEITRCHERGRILLLQYAPNAFGYHGMNLMLCFWAFKRSEVNREDIRVMFHEPFFYFTRQRIQRNLLAIVQRFMAFLLLRASSVVYVATSAWIPILHRYGSSRAQRATCLPIPSTVKPVDDVAEVRRIRNKINPKKTSKIIGHFGTYGEHQRPGVSRLLSMILHQEPTAIGVCLGANGDTFAETMVTQNLLLAGRVVGPGYLGSIATSLHIQACDLFIQPYPDGATTRRTTLMAILSHGVATITTRGKLTESVWLDPLAPPSFRPEEEAEIASKAVSVVADPKLCRQIGANGKQLYDREFSIETTLSRLGQITKIG